MSTQDPRESLDVRNTAADPLDVPARAPMPMLPTGPCWVCGGATLDRVWSDSFDLSEFPRFGDYVHAEHPPSWVVRCRRCGFGQPESLPATPDYFDLIYAINWELCDLDREFDCGYKDAIFRHLLEGLQRRWPRGMQRSVLDVGTHVGRFVYLAREAGWDAEGVELNPVTAEYAARRSGATIHRVKAQDLATHGKRYGAVTLTDVLEHIPRPVEVLAGIRSLLHSGGLVAIKVPNGPAQRVKETVRRTVLRRSDARIATRFVHVNHFTVASLRRCLESAGFREVTIQVAVPDFLPARYARRTLTEAGSALLRLAVYHAARLIPGGVHTPMGLNLQAFAINPAESK
jgi:2-polyprenyl-3-methyl-5-hydroxy-6-metoxy-1,4-benzoquinol methylase